MTEITLRLQDDLIRDYGEVFIKKFLEKQMEHLSLMRTMDRIEEQIKSANIDYEIELENIREKAWQEYKGDFTN